MQPHNVEELEELLSRPTPGVLKTMDAHPGDVVVLGVAGKMGPTLARMVRRAREQLGQDGRVYGVARFSDPRTEAPLRAAGIETVRCDLSDPAAVAALPDAPLVLFLAGQKFGTTDAPETTWIMNAYVPALAAQRYRTSRIVAFSTGCVYPDTPVARGGSREDDPLEPIGEYANSCIGRERIFTYYSRQNGTPVALFRLNYAVDLRYGVLVDIARRVQAGEPVDVTTGQVNVIWQGDACAQAIRCLDHAASPPFAVNVTGPETVSVRYLAERFGELMGKEPRFVGTEGERALLSNAGRAHHLFGYPTVPLEELIEAVAAWLRQGGPLLDKPTHYETRDGKY